MTNLGSLCIRDHLLKTHGNFTVEQVEPGIFEWRTPSGHRYRRERDGSTVLLSHCGPPRATILPGPTDRGPRESQTVRRDALETAATAARTIGAGDAPMASMDDCDPGPPF
ncbi:hypothetical protein [Ruania halotolerans]|uniref:hypothetical protein n=1 Tax=Ruania halotolerans TaxID=2897773 RepID=UPI001E5B5415|nr:hypothetical protein [Ruania halotolerans]UFU05160.1 hypothetical protein LQF10_11830 [Ruania halotolerans]